MTITPNNRLVQLLFFWTCFFSFNVTISQIKIDTITASQYYKKADSLLIIKKHEESIVLFNKALLRYKNAKIWEKVASCYNKISENQWRTRKSEESFQNSKRALIISDKYLINENQQEAYAYDNIGNYYENISDYNNALVYYKKALKIQQRLFPEYHLDIAKSYNNIGILYYRKEKFEKALKYYKKAMTVYLKIFGSDHKKTVSIYNNIGIVYKNLGKFNLAIEYYRKAIVVSTKNFKKNDINTGSYYLNMGVAYSELKDDRALDCYKKALLIYKEQKHLIGLSSIYQNFGVFYHLKGEYDKALEYNKKGLDKAIKYYGEYHAVIGSIYHNIGITFSVKGDFEKALHNYEKAIQIYKAIFKENDEDTAHVYESIGDMYMHKKEYDIALLYYKRSLKIRNSIFGKENLKIANMYYNIAKLYHEKKNYNDALLYFRKGLTILQKIYGEEHLLTVSFYNNIAEVYYKQEEYQEAISNFNRAFIANIKNNNLKDIQNTFNTSNYYDHILLLKTLQGKAKTLLGRFQKKHDKQDFEESKAIYQNANHVINAIRQSYQNYQDKLAFAKKTKDIYADVIKAYVLLYKETKEQQYLLDAFYYAEKGKANTLKELLTDVSAKGFAGLPPEILETEKLLKTNRAFYQSQITDELSNIASDSVKIRSYENKLFDINRKQDSLTSLFEKNYPKYYQLKHQYDNISVSQIQQKLNKNTTILEFFTTDSITYAYTITKQKLDIKELIAPNLEKQVSQLRKAITSKNLGNYKKVAHQLYKTLIAPIHDKFVGDELIIVRDGSLWHLNFDLLLAGNDVSEDPGDFSYLLKQYAITYVNSANLLFNSFKEKALRDEREECLAFSFSDSINAAASKNMSLAVLRDSGDDLPGTRKEIKVISDIIDGQYYFGTEANEANFKKNATRYKILHLALHGEVDNENPENSKLFFTKSRDTIEDNLLYAHELFALDIPSELTVLSACNTGTGKIAKGEGIMSLGNAFQYAGTKSLLLSSWEVPDDTAPELMHYFYTNLKNGMNKGKALQQAKLKYLTTADRYHKAPFYWGGFYLVGDSAPIEFNTTSFWYWILGFCVLAILLIGLFYYRRKRI